MLNCALSHDPNNASLTSTKRKINRRGTAAVLLGFKVEPIMNDSEELLTNVFDVSVNRIV
jgi:hypothetical protein